MFLFPYLTYKYVNCLYSWGFLLFVLFVNNLKLLKINNIFKVPAVPKKAVPEEKVPVPVPKKVVAPPAKGIEPLYEAYKENQW